MAVIKIQESAEPIAPESGFVKIWIEGNAVKYKNDANNVFTLATGITAEVLQDLVGALLQSNSDINVIYDDIGNAITFTINESALNHQLLSGAGSNTHAQIDSHIGSTSNPHNVTKSQVGLGNVDNTSDSDKPISTATQTALNGKENTGVAASVVSSHESASNPHPQYETSTEAQAKVDAHANLTDNPHSVTKAQVGLGNIDNTSDINKPISTATQTALNLKYDASNPNGYETPSQLNTRDTNNRNRANHTGTQLSSSISDFTNSVLSTLLTGYSIGANLALLATDSVLVALGKLQAQINAIVGSLVRGDNFQYFEDLTTATTTSSTYSDAASFTTTTKQAGNYRIGCQIRFSAHATNNDFLFRLLVDGVQVGAEIAEESQDSASQGNVRHIWGYVDFPVDATHTIAVQFRTENNNSGTLTCSEVYVEMWRR